MGREVVGALISDTCGSIEVDLEHLGMFICRQNRALDQETERVDSEAPSYKCDV